MMVFVALYLWFSGLSTVSVYAPELVIDESALALTIDLKDYGYQVIFSQGNPDWYSFIFLGIKTRENVSGLVFTVNNHGLEYSDMQDRPILFWYDTMENKKSIGEIYFRGHMRPLCLAPAGRSLPCH